MLKFNLMESGLLSVFPWMTMAISANAGGWIADTLVSKGFSVTNVRKVPVFVSIFKCKSNQSNSFDNPFVLFPMMDSDNANNWVSWTSVLSNTAETH